MGGSDVEKRCFPFFCAIWAIKIGEDALSLHRDAKSGGTSAIDASIIALGLH